LSRLASTVSDRCRRMCLRRRSSHSWKASAASWTSSRADCELSASSQNPYLQSAIQFGWRNHLTCGSRV